jgi:hypothetical protein
MRCKYMLLLCMYFNLKLTFNRSKQDQLANTPSVPRYKKKLIKEN